MLKTEQTIAKHTRSRHARLLLSVVLIAVALLVGLQQYKVKLGSPSNADIAASTENRLGIVRRSLKTATKPVVTAENDHPIHSITTTADVALPLATSMSGARATLADFIVPTANTANSAIVSNSAKAANSAKTKYQFKQKLNQSLFTAIVSSPFAIGFEEDARLAIWQENQQFALVKKAYQFVIMLDPGHGGSDPGSIGHNGLQEKTLTLDIAKRAQRLLSKNKNISVVLTRNSDSGMSRKDRVHKVKRSNADMFVSLHLNHLPQTEVNLVETFYAAPRNILESIRKQRSAANNNGMLETSSTLNPDLAFTQGSRELASIMQKRVFDEVIDNNPETDNAGVKEDTLYILTRSFTPGALIEMSCLSNINEANRLNSSAYREKLATALANGIKDYLATPAAKRHFGPEV